jgi:protein-tyrosine-phosphatase
VKVLFVCEGNMFRSQVAELFYNTMSVSHDAQSAGTDAALYDRASHRAEAVMQEIGMTLAGQSSKQVTSDMVEEADKIILFPVPVTPSFLTDDDKVEVWDIEDLGYNKEGDTIAVDRQVCDAIRSRVTDCIWNEREV